MFKKLSGLKTYLGCIAFGVNHILLAFGLYEESTATLADTLIVAWTGVAFRHAMKKNGKGG